MKRSFLCIFLCLALLLPQLIACGSSDPENGDGGQRPAAPTGSPATTLFASAMPDVACEPLLELEDAGALRAACTNNGYLYYVLQGNGGNSAIYRRDLLREDTVKEGPAISVGDAVSMCYNSTASVLVIAHGDQTLSVIDPDTLEVKETHTASGTVECITYLPGEGCYAARMTGKRNLILLDDSFAQTRVLSLPADLTAHNVIDITADSEYVYFLTDSKEVTVGANRAAVMIYHIASGEALKNVFSFSTSGRKLTAIAFNGADFLVATSDFISGDIVYSGALTPLKGESKPFDLVSRMISTGVDSNGITSERLFKTYKLASGLGANNVMQGGCTDGKYGYFCMEDQAGNYEDTTLHRTRIVKVDMETGELVAVSDNLPLHHSNDMTYNSRTGQLLVVHCGKGEHSKSLSYVDPNTLEITGTETLPVGFYCIAYDEVNDRYMVGSGGRNFVILDSEFNVLVPKVNVGAASYCKEEELITQGSDCDSEYVYVVLGGKNSSGPWVNYLVVYDWNGNLIMAKIIPDMTDESENIFHIGNTIYVACNGGDEPVYRIEIDY